MSANKCLNNRFRRTEMGTGIKAAWEICDRVFCWEKIKAYIPLDSPVSNIKTFHFVRIISVALVIHTAGISKLAL